MAIPAVDERRKRPSTIVPPPNGAASSPPMSPVPRAPSATPMADAARQPFAGRAAALERLENKGPTIGDLARGAYTGVPRVIAGTVLEQPAKVGDAMRRGVASATGRELVQPTALQDRAKAITGGGADDLGATLKAAGGAATKLLGAVPIGDTRPAAPARAPAASPAAAPKSGTPELLQRPTEPTAPTVGQAMAPKAGTVEVPRGTLADLAATPKSADFERGTVSVIPSGDARSENQRYLAMREQGREANIAAQQRIAGASIENARTQTVRNALQSDLNRTRAPSARELKTRDGQRAADARLDTVQAITQLSRPPAPENTTTLGDILARDAKASNEQSQARLAESQAITAQQTADAAQRKEQTLGELLGKLTPEQQIVALTGNDPRSAAKSNFQIATNEGPNPDNPYGPPVKTSYLIDGGGNVRPVAGGAAAPTVTVEGARAAIAAGADKAAVNARLKAAGLPEIT